MRGRVREAADVPGVRFHDLRHTYARALRQGRHADGRTAATARPCLDLDDAAIRGLCPSANQRPLRGRPGGARYGRRAAETCPDGSGRGSGAPLAPSCLSPASESDPGTPGSPRVSCQREGTGDALLDQRSQPVRHQTQLERRENITASTNAWFLQAGRGFTPHYQCGEGGWDRQAYCKQSKRVPRARGAPGPSFEVRRPSCRLPPSKLKRGPQRRRWPRATVTQRASGGCSLPSLPDDRRVRGSTRRPPTG